MEAFTCHSAEPYYTTLADPNKQLRLRNDEGKWVTEESGKATIATNFYQTLFTSESRVPNMTDKVANLPFSHSVTPQMNAVDGGSIA
ncbi:unnamed protein product [Linum trigynum]|uniref:Uncharacterized protein n=1 Tax=Linum trigynum TaxID=586398 RepID=A0AAV2CTW1_9ROSI